MMIIGYLHLLLCFTRQNVSMIKMCFPDRNGVMQYACNIRNANFTNLYLILSKYKICLCVCIKILHIHREYDNEHDDSIYFARADNELIVCVI